MVVRTGGPGKESTHSFMVSATSFFRFAIGERHGSNNIVNNDDGLPNDLSDTRSIFCHATKSAISALEACHGSCSKDWQMDLSLHSEITTALP